ncbi:MAG: hypothetical protein ACKN85_13455 [Pirellula sp.]
MTRKNIPILAQGETDHYNRDRLHSAIGYITPDDTLAGKQQAVHEERDRKLEHAPPGPCNG